MSWYIKYFEYGGQNISFFIKDDIVLEKYKKIWDVIKISSKLNFIAYLFMIKDTLKLK